MNKFLFLYPRGEFFDYEIEQGAYCKIHDYEDLMEQFGEEAEGVSEQQLEKLREKYLALSAEKYQPEYKTALNRCIDERYRQKGFQIFFVPYLNDVVSDIVKLQPEDTIIFADTSFEYGREIYPRSDAILNQVGDAEYLVVAGFHFGDCVDKVAKRSHERGVKTLVDSDLTELFSGVIKKPDFRYDTYPSCFFPENKHELERIMRFRKDKPWLWQYNVDDIRNS